MQNMKKRIFMITITCLMSMTACGTWVDMVGSGCTDQLVKRTKLKVFGKTNPALTVTCKKAGKVYAGDVRCNNGKLQVKCK